MNNDRPNLIPASLLLAAGLLFGGCSSTQSFRPTAYDLHQRTGKLIAPPMQYATSDLAPYSRILANRSVSSTDNPPALTRTGGPPSAAAGEAED
ncbi:MAG: hypothetical protein EA425_02690 [Puniceicoccaceae bacterium]|nr:MAG: hypothetical protein EA425_02690 [Puniceicoccaceae bacterium]